MKKGYTLVELLMVISLVGILAATGVSMFNTTLDDAKFDATHKEMLQLRKAMIGELENTNLQGQRVRFGYIGDNGAIPTSAQGLAALMSNPAGVNAWSIHSSQKLGTGWNGPYIVATSTSDYTKDAWGRDYIYNTTGTPYILSYGSDGTSGGTGAATDIQVDVQTDIRYANVSGQLISSGSVFTGSAYVEFFYPTSSGGITSSTATISAGNSGAFSFSSVPMGIRALKVQIPTSVNPSITIGPITFPVDQQTFQIPEHLLEVVPQTSISNCNSIANITVDSVTRNASNSRIDFQIDIKASFTISTVYINNRDSALGNARPIEAIAINGVEYACQPTVGWFTGYTIANLAGLNGCGSGSDNNIDPDTLSTITLKTAWNIPGGDNQRGYIRFNAATTNISWVDLGLGCDTFRLTP